MYEQQPLKMSSAEALCETEAPASFSIFAFGKLGSNECDDVHSITVPYLLCYLAHGDFSTAVPGVNELQEEYAAVYGETYPDDPSFGDKAGEPVDYTPVLAVTYWSFRLMIGMGAVSAGGRRLRAVGHAEGPGADVADRRLRLAARRRRARSSPTRPAGSSPRWAASRSSSTRTPTSRSTSRSGSSPPRPSPPASRAAEVWTSLISLTVVYGALAVVELWLITRFVRRGRHHRRRRTGARHTPEGASGRRPARRRRAAATTTSSRSPTEARSLTMDLQTLWFAAVAVLWTGFLLLEGFDFGVAALLPVLGRPHRRPAPDAAQHRPALGRQRGLADHRRRRGVRRLPRLVRHLAAGALPAVRAGAVRADHPGGRLRVAALAPHARPGTRPGRGSSPPAR